MMSAFSRQSAVYRDQQRQHLRQQQAGRSKSHQTSHPHVKKPFAGTSFGASALHNRAVPRENVKSASSSSTGRRMAQGNGGIMNNMAAFCGKPLPTATPMPRQPRRSLFTATMEQPQQSLSVPPGSIAFPTSDDNTMGMEMSQLTENSGSTNSQYSLYHQQSGSFFGRGGTQENCSGSNGSASYNTSVPCPLLGQLSYTSMSSRATSSSKNKTLHGPQQTPPQVRNGDQHSLQLAHPQQKQAFSHHPAGHHSRQSKTTSTTLHHHQGPNWQNFGRPAKIAPPSTMLRSETTAPPFHSVHHPPAMASDSHQSSTKQHSFCSQAAAATALPTNGGGLSQRSVVSRESRTSEPRMSTGGTQSSMAFGQRRLKDGGTARMASKSDRNWEMMRGVYESTGGPMDRPKKSLIKPTMSEAATLGANPGPQGSTLCRTVPKMQTTAVLSHEMLNWAKAEFKKHMSSCLQHAASELKDRFGDQSKTIEASLEFVKEKIVEEIERTKDTKVQDIESAKDKAVREIEQSHETQESKAFKLHETRVQFYQEKEDVIDGKISRFYDFVSKAQEDAVAVIGRATDAALDKLEKAEDLVQNSILPTVKSHVFSFLKSMHLANNHDDVATVPSTPTTSTPSTASNLPAAAPPAKEASPMRRPRAVSDQKENHGSKSTTSQTSSNSRSRGKTKVAGNKHKAKKKRVACKPLTRVETVAVNASRKERSSPAATHVEGGNDEYPCTASLLQQDKKKKNSYVTPFCMSKKKSLIGASTVAPSVKSQATVPSPPADTMAQQLKVTKPLQLERRTATKTKRGNKRVVSHAHNNKATMDLTDDLRFNFSKRQQRPAAGNKRRRTFF